jgi:hypothetical protein
MLLVNSKPCSNNYLLKTSSFRGSKQLIDGMHMIQSKLSGNATTLAKYGANEADLNEK